MNEKNCIGFSSFNDHVYLNPCDYNVSGLGFASLCVILGGYARMIFETNIELVKKKNKYRIGFCPRVNFISYKLCKKKLISYKYSKKNYFE